MFTNWLAMGWSFAVCKTGIQIIKIIMLATDYFQESLYSRLPRK